MDSSFDHRHKAYKQQYVALRNAVTHYLHNHEEPEAAADGIAAALVAEMRRDPERELFGWFMHAGAETMPALLATLDARHPRLMSSVLDVHNFGPIGSASGQGKDGKHTMQIIGPLETNVKRRAYTGPFRMKALQEKLRGASDSAIRTYFSRSANRRELNIVKTSRTGHSNYGDYHIKSSALKKLRDELGR